MVEDHSAQRQLAIKIADATASAHERMAIVIWATELIEVRNSDHSRLKKARDAIAITLSKQVVWHAIKIAARETKRAAWDNRGRTSRWGIGGAAISLALFGTQNAGIAALGTAVGVPLWVVCGAGASFANILIEEMTRRVTKDSKDAGFIKIDAERVPQREQ